MSGSYRLKLSRPALKMRVVTRLPARIEALGPILLEVVNGVYTFSLDSDALLAQFDAIYSGRYELRDEVIQTVTTASDTIQLATTLLVVQRASPTLTELTLPNLGGSLRRIIDWSTSVTNHEIKLTPHTVGETIMKAATWSAFSNSVELTSLSLRYSTDLNGWYKA